MFELLTVNTETNTTEVSFAPYSVDQQISYLSMGYSPAIYIDEPEALYGQTCWEIDNYQEANTALADDLLAALEEIMPTRKTDWNKCYDDVHDPDSIDTEDPRF